MISEDTFINLTGVACPMNYVRAKLLIDTMKSGQILRIELDNGEPLESVKKSLTEDGHQVLELNRFDQFSELFVKKAS